MRRGASLPGPLRQLSKVQVSSPFSSFALVISLRPPPGAPMKLPLGLPVSTPLISSHHARRRVSDGTVISHRPLISL
jgi:hypothetical protein